MTSGMIHESSRAAYASSGRRKALHFKLVMRLRVRDNWGVPDVALSPQRVSVSSLLRPSKPLKRWSKTISDTSPSLALPEAGSAAAWHAAAFFQGPFIMKYAL